MSGHRTSLRAHSPTRASEVFTWRRRARAAGLQKGGGILLATLAVVTFVLFRFDYDLREGASWLLGLGLSAPVLLVWGAHHWRRAQREDDAHHRFQKAPSLPLNLVRDHDDVWVEGRLRCPQPLRPNGFARHCSWYHLVVEQQRGSGNRSRWVKVAETRRGAIIWIVDAPREIEVDMRRVLVDYPEVRVRREDRKRYTLRYLPASGSVSACGVARRRLEVLGEHQAAARDAALDAWIEKHRAEQEREEARLRRMGRRERLKAAGRAIRARKRRRPLRRPRPRDAWHYGSLDDAHGVPDEQRMMLTRARHLPLLVTALPRHLWHDRSEADELSARAAADVLLGYGIPTTVWALGVWLAWWPLAWFPGVPVGVAVLLAVLLPSRVVRLYNRMVRYRQRVRSARADLAADLEMRRSLVPRLVEVVAASARHERAVQQRLAALRDDRGERDATETVRALQEALPALSAQPNFRLLADDLTALEEKVAFGRARIHDAAAEYETLLQRFPNNLLAAVTGLRTQVSGAS